MFINIDDKYTQNWQDIYTKKNRSVNLFKLIKNKTWISYFSAESNRVYVKKINTYLNNETKKNINIFPFPKFVFYTFNTLDFYNIRVVILGQDPYFNMRKYKNVLYPEAMGASFSVPDGISLPPTLVNIYVNQYKFKHIKTIPKNGDLTKWILQGCLLLNTALTVAENKKKSHCKIWSKLIDNLIKHISDNINFVIFVLWGSIALSKKSLIDTDKHKLIISSHPSPLSAHKELGNYPAFKNVDHFGIINKYINKEHPTNKRSIDWKIN